MAQELGESTGIVYKITNTINGKCYIGQTKVYYGKKKGGIDRRWKRHISTAKNPKKTGCPYFGNAINKHGQENFETEILCYCKIEWRDFYEKLAIHRYKSNDKEFGYNIADGGSGVHYAKRITEDFRKKISAAQTPNSGIMNILHIHNKDGSIRGYRVCRKVDGIDHTKAFVHKRNSLEENLELAKQYLAKLQSGDLHDDNKYNRISELPRNISYCIDKYTKQKVGYNINVLRNGKTYLRSIGRKDLTMEQKLEIAIKMKKEILDGLR